MDRYGALLLCHYDKLDKLPKAALPDTPPTGQHQYRVWMKPNVFAKIDLRGAITVKHEERGRQITWRFEGEGEMIEAWGKARRLAIQWTNEPPYHTPAAWARTVRAARVGRAAAAQGLPAPAILPMPVARQPAPAARHAAAPLPMLALENVSGQEAENDNDSDVEVGTPQDDVFSDSSPPGLFSDSDDSGWTTQSSSFSSVSASTVYPRVARLRLEASLRRGAPLEEDAE